MWRLNQTCEVFKTSQVSDRRGYHNRLVGLKGEGQFTFLDGQTSEVFKTSQVYYHPSPGDLLPIAEETAVRSTIGQGG
jgi:hypothetical protein